MFGYAAFLLLGPSTEVVLAAVRADLEPVVFDRTMTTTTDSTTQGKEIFAEKLVPAISTIAQRLQSQPLAVITDCFVHPAHHHNPSPSRTMSRSPATPSRHSSRPSSQWLFTKSETRNSPSIKEGLDPKQERSNRLKGIQFIDTVGRKLKLLQPTIATAAMFFHRFYMRQPMQKFHHFVPLQIPMLAFLIVLVYFPQYFQIQSYLSCLCSLLFQMMCFSPRFLDHSHIQDVAATSLFLSTKVEENPRKLPHLITCAARFTQQNWDLEIDEQSKEYWNWRDTILYTEEWLLEALCFDFDVIHPYDHLMKLVHRFCPGNSVLGKCAWAFINDRYAFPFSL